MEYRDFDVRLRPGLGGIWEADARAPFGADGAAEIRLPFPVEEIPERLERFEAQVLHARGVRIVRDEVASAGDPKQFGAELFDAVFREEVLDAYRVSLLMARGEGAGLRLRFSNQIPELEGVPWEFMYDRAEDVFPALVPSTPLVRHVRLPRPTHSLTVSPPLRILGVIASPSDLPRLAVDHEKRQMERAVAPAREAGLVSLTWLETATWEDLKTKIQAEPWHVLHFIGHGDVDVESGEGVLMLEDEGGRAFELKAEDLGPILDLQSSLRLVVLNSCSGARGHSQDPLASTATTLVKYGMNAVVAMQFKIGDAAALLFSSALYRAVADGAAIDRAVCQARLTMKIEGGQSFEWGTPVLHMRSADGVLFKPEQAAPVDEPQDDNPPDPGTEYAGPSPPLKPFYTTDDAADTIGVTVSERPGAAAVEIRLTLDRPDMWWKGIGFGADPAPQIEGDLGGLKGSIVLDPGMVTVHWHKAKFLGVKTKVGAEQLDLREYGGYAIDFTWVSD